MCGLARRLGDLDVIVKEKVLLYDDISGIMPIRSLGRANRLEIRCYTYVGYVLAVLASLNQNPLISSDNNSKIIIPRALVRAKYSQAVMPAR
jgi:hypothetical protein